jgi:anthranilate/para-aminobenzoate synthase component II
MILVVDHYDSFTYNLVQLIESLGRARPHYRRDGRNVHQAELVLTFR